MNTHHPPAPPGLLNIGVTGHRRLKDIQGSKKTVHRVFEDINNRYANPDGTIKKWRLFSPLAEGADRLVAREILGLKNQVRITAVLPLAMEDYLEDFQTYASTIEFHNLAAKSDSIRRLRATRIKEEFSEEERALARVKAYEAAGRFVVDHCQVLIALWDQKPSRGRGGTAEIIAYAKNQERPIYMINTDAPGEFLYIRPT